MMRYEGERLAVLVGTKICTFKGAAEQTYIGLFLSGGERLIRLEHTYESQKNEGLSFEYEDTKMRFKTRESSSCTAADMAGFARLTVNLKTYITNKALENNNAG